MKKTFTILVALLVMVTGLFAVSNDKRKTVDEFFDDYEEFLELYEKAIKSNNLMDMMALSEKSIELAETAEDLQDYDCWTLKDTKRLLEIEEKLAKILDESTPKSAAPKQEMPDLGSIPNLGSIPDVGSIPSFSF